MASFLYDLECALQKKKTANPQQSYTAKLLQGDENQLFKKLIEEAGELALALKDGEAQRICEESADLLFHLLVSLIHRGVAFRDVIGELMKRHR